MLNVDWWLVTDVSVQPIGPIVKNQAVKKKNLGCTETSVTADLLCVTSKTERRYNFHLNGHLTP